MKMENFAGMVGVFVKYGVKERCETEGPPIFMIGGHVLNILRMKSI